MPLHNPTAHKTKTLSAAPSFLQNANGGGFKGPAKRSAFGDLSNTAGHVARHNMPANNLAKSTVNKATTTAKVAPLRGENKENAAKNAKNNDAFLRPAQRKPSSQNYPLPTVQNDHRAQPVIKQTVAKKATLVYNDEQHQRPQSLSRQYRSQPHLKSVEGAVLRRTQSKNHIHEEFRAPTEDELYEEPYEEPYEDALEELSHEEPAHGPVGMAPVGLPGATGPLITVDMKPMQPVVANSLQPMSAIPLMPEPEEQWDDEDDDEDLYDEHGYTTAHSLKSYADNTLGATVLLAPKLTSKVQRQLDEAREFVEMTRPQEDIDEEEWDVSMVAEYGEEIFQYMRELEVSRAPCNHPTRVSHG